MITYCTSKLHGGIDGVSRHIHNIMKNTTVFEGYSLKKMVRFACFLFKILCQ